MLSRHGDKRTWEESLPCGSKDPEVEEPCQEVPSVSIEHCQVLPSDSRTSSLPGEISPRGPNKDQSHAVATQAQLALSHGPRNSDPMQSTDDFGSALVVRQNQSPPRYSAWVSPPLNPCSLRMRLQKGGGPTWERILYRGCGALSRNCAISMSSK